MTSAISRLAAAIDADQGLAWPDFRAEERTFALLTQLAGRSGRSGDPGGVIVQAWDPAARAVELASRHAVEEFLTGELERRELLGYPPFRHLVRVEVTAPGAEVPERRADGAARGGQAAPARRRAARPGAALSRARPPPRPAAAQDLETRACRSRRSATSSLVRAGRCGGPKPRSSWTSIRSDGVGFARAMSTTGEEHEEHVMSRREREEARSEELRRVIALSQVRQYPEVVLRQVAKPVTEFGPDLIALVGRMERLMDDAHGVGLAAPQVGLRRRLFVFRRDGGRARAGRGQSRDHRRSDETSVDDEGCLSLGPVRMPVERATGVTLEFQDVDGERRTLELEGLDARVVQHEIDHLDGVLIIDRTTDEARREAMADPAPASRAALTAAGRRVGFAGTSAWAADALRGLHVAPGIEIAGGADPARSPRRARKAPAPSARRGCGERLGIELLQPERPQAALAALQTAGCEAMACVAYGELVPRPMLDALPWLNLHPSLLPRWRGAAPIERALMAGERASPVSP